MSDDLARAFYQGVKAGEDYADEHQRWMNSGTLYTRDQSARPKRPISPYPTEESELTLTCYAMASYGEGGSKYYVEGHRVDRASWERFTWWPGNPIFDALLKEQDRCTNCWMPPGMCGCCYGCGEPHADISPTHATPPLCVFSISDFI